MIGLSYTLAQTRIKGTDLFIVVNKESNAVTHIELLNDESANYLLLAKKYSSAKFYKGKIAGTYRTSDNVITPLRGSTVTIYTHEQYVRGNCFIAADTYIPGKKMAVGDPFNLAGLKSRVSLLNGIFVLKVL